MFYSLSYDWSKGASYCPSDPNATQIMLHPVVDAEIQRKPAAPAQGNAHTHTPGIQAHTILDDAMY